MRKICGLCRQPRICVGATVGSSQIAENRVRVSKNIAIVDEHGDLSERSKGQKLLIPMLPFRDAYLDGVKGDGQQIQQKLYLVRIS